MEVTSRAWVLGRFPPSGPGGCAYAPASGGEKGTKGARSRLSELCLQDKGLGGCLERDDDDLEGTLWRSRIDDES
jgi:hypothetical protein